MTCPARELLERAKLLYALGKLSVEMPTDLVTQYQAEAAEIIQEIDQALAAKCWWCRLWGLFREE
mgnify:CR=1 FL=1